MITGATIATVKYHVRVQFLESGSGTKDLQQTEQTLVTQDT